MTAAPTANASTSVEVVSTDSDAFAAAHRRLLDDASLQFDLPGATVDKPPAWLEAFLRFLGANREVVTTTFYVMLALAGAWVAWQVGRALYRRRQERQGTETPQAAWRPDAGVARALIAEADALAAEGRFGEAAHLLLFRSVADIDARRPDMIRPALTSREIASQPRLPAGARGAFTTIADIVERSLFAARPLGASGWGRARAAYADFALDGQWK